MSENSPEARWNVPPPWTWATMCEVADIVGGGTPDTKEPRYWGGEVPWITPADLSGYTAKTISRGARSITEDGLARSGAQLMPSGSVLMSSRAPVGYVAVAATELSTNQGFKSFVLRDVLLPDYVYWYLRGNRDLVLEFASGTTFMEVSGKRAGGIPIPLAPLPEQRRIVAVIEEHLSDLDAAVGALERVVANLRRYRSAVLRASVDGTLSRGWDTSTSAIGPNYAPIRLADGWEWKTVDELSAVIEYGTSSKTNEDARGIPVLRMGNIVDGRLVVDELKFLPERHPEFPALLLRTGDILFNRTNSPELVGKSAVYLGHPERASFASYLLRIRVKPEAILPEYLAGYINSSYGRAWVSTVVTQQVGQANVNGTKLRALQVPVPPLAEQRQIVAEVERRLTTLERTEADVDAQLRRAVRLRQSILKRAFEGKLVPQDPADEPASVLLDRIRGESAIPTAHRAGARGRRAARR